MSPYCRWWDAGLTTDGGMLSPFRQAPPAPCAGDTGRNGSMSHITPDTAASESATASPALPAASLPLETRAGLGSGQNFWQTKEADGVPSFTLTDGPHGLRKQKGSSDHLGLAGSVKATCFPPAALTPSAAPPNLA